MKPVEWLVVCSALLWSASLARAEDIAGVPTGTAGFVGQTEFGPLDEPRLVGSYGEFLSTFGGSTSGLANPYLPASAAAFFANGGQRLYVVRVADADDATLIGLDAGPGHRTGLQALRDVDEISIVAIPGATTLAVQAAMIALCESERDRMAVLDPDSIDDVDAVLAQRANLGSAEGYAALYFPWIEASPADAHGGEQNAFGEQGESGCISAGHSLAPPIHGTVEFPPALGASRALDTNARRSAHPVRRAARHRGRLTR